jgi:spore coat-associated protein N
MKSQNVNKAVKRSGTRIALASAFAIGVLGLVGAGVYAGLNATATGTQTVSSGTLSLIVTPGVGTGFGQTYTNVAPGDVINSYVNLTNGSSLDAQALTLKVVGTGSTRLTTDATLGLHVTINQCSTAWTLLSGTCSGSTTMMASTAISSLTTTPGSLVSGTVATSAVYHLQVSLSLPDQNETTVNGTTPTTSIQGLGPVTLTYTFDELQRTATTTNS